MVLASHQLALTDRLGNARVEVRRDDRGIYANASSPAMFPGWGRSLSRLGTESRPASRPGQPRHVADASWDKGSHLARVTTPTTVRSAG